MSVGDRPEALDEKRSNFLRQVTAAVIIDQVTVEVVEALSNDGIPSILLKGPAIANWLYDHPSERPYSDADLLVDPRRLDAARAILERLGFAGGAVEVSRFAPRSYAETWTREAIVELHRTLSGVGVADEDAWAVLSPETETMAIDAAQVHILTPAGKTLVVALHAAHHGEAVRPTLRDLGRALEVIPPGVWREAATLAARLDAAAAFGTGLRLLPRGVALAEELGVANARSMEAEIRVISHSDMPHLLLWLRSGDATLGQKARVVARKLVPPPEWLRTTSALGSSGRLGLAAAYVVRPIVLASRLPAALGALWRARRAVSRDARENVER